MEFQAFTNAILHPQIGKENKPSRTNTPLTQPYQNKNKPIPINKANIQPYKNQLKNQRSRKTR